MVIFREFTFDSAHFLPKVSIDHRCRSTHGHTYRLKVFVEGKVNKNTGWVVDFSDLKAKVGEVLMMLDHKFLNKVKGLENPTCEILAEWIFERLKKKFPGLKKIELWETPNAGVVLEG